MSLEERFLTRLTDANNIATIIKITRNAVLFTIFCPKLDNLDASSVREYAPSIKSKARGQIAIRDDTIDRIDPTRTGLEVL